LRVGRLHSLGRRDVALASVRGRLPRAWRALAHGFAFAALLAVLLAPLHLCCVNYPVVAASNSGDAAAVQGANASHCAHHGGDHRDRAPASPNGDQCPGCYLAGGAALIPPPAIAAAAYAQGAIDILAPPETLGFRVAARIPAARPRAPPILI